ncbi:MAG: biotin--[acetyl-CoA-carboxylase] ligase [Acidimicrobiia bacterium]
MATPYALHRVARTGSTQDDARELATKEPVLVIADEQTEGRGRSGRRWETAPRALATSLAWRPNWPRSAWARLSLVAGLAARETLREVFDVEAGIKWPNDLVTDDGKVAGLLVEVSDDLPVAGLGVNLWWPDAPDGHAGLMVTDPGSGIVQHLAEAWAQRVLARTELPAHEWGRAEYEQHCLTLGQVVRWQPRGTGKAVGVAEDGALIVETEEGVQRLSVGEVWELRSY